MTTTRFIRERPYTPALPAQHALYAARAEAARLRMVVNVLLSRLASGPEGERLRVWVQRVMQSNETGE